MAGALRPALCRGGGGGPRRRRAAYSSRLRAGLRRLSLRTRGARASGAGIAMSGTTRARDILDVHPLDLLLVRRHDLVREKPRQQRRGRARATSHGWESQGDVESSGECDASTIVWVGGLGGGALLASVQIRVPRVYDRRYVTACSVTLCVWAPTRYCVAPLCGALAPGCLVCPSSFPCVLLGLAGVCSVCV